MASLVEKRLGRLPQDLSRIYHETFTERFDEYREEEAAIAQSALRWLICSQVPLTTEKFLALVSSSACQRPTVSISRDDLLDLCFNFVIHDAGLNIFRFSHLSVREYLESTEDYQLRSCHAFAAEYCLRILTSDLGINQTHLNDGEDCVVDSLADESGVDRYVCVYWPHHLKQSGLQRHLEPLKTLFCAFTMEQQIDSSHFSQWNEKTSVLDDEIRRSGKYSPENVVISFPSDPLFVACVWGFEELLHWRVHKDTRSLDVRNHCGMTALHVTCQFGNLKAARVLLEKGVDLEASVHGRTALGLANFYRHTDLVQLLINNIARSELEQVHHFSLLDAIWGNSTVVVHKLVDLEKAITWSKGGGFIQLLLDSGDPPAFQSQPSPLEAAVRAGQEDNVSMLIERGARIDGIDYELATGPCGVFLGSLLDMAESRGYVAIARLLSRRGARSAVRRLTQQEYEDFKKESVYELE